MQGDRPRYWKKDDNWEADECLLKEGDYVRDNKQNVFGHIVSVMDKRRSYMIDIGDMVVELYTDEVQEATKEEYEVAKVMLS